MIHGNDDNAMIQSMVWYVFFSFLNKHPPIYKFNLIIEPINYIIIYVFTLISILSNGNFI